MEDAKKNPKPEQSSRCPICGKPAYVDYRPFCSRRCADVDLARWLKGGYAIAADPEAKPPSSSSSDDEDEDL